MVVYFSCDTAVSIPSFVLVVNLDNFCLDFLVFVWNPHPLQMVVEGRARKLSDCEQKGQRELMPQFLNYLRFLRWRRSSSKTKACKFFRYAFSARSRCTSASRSSSTLSGSFFGLPVLLRPLRSTARPSAPSSK